MGHLSGVDWVIFAVAGWVAVTALTRLMIARRERLIAEFRVRTAEEARQQQAAERAVKRQTPTRKAA